MPPNIPPPFAQTATVIKGVDGTTSFDSFSRLLDRISLSSAAAFGKSNKLRLSQFVNQQTVMQSRVGHDAHVG